MRVKLKSLMAGPDGVFQPGQIVDREDAGDLIAGGYAEAVETPAKEAAVEESTPEAAVHSPAPENARRPNARTQRRKS